MIGMLSAIGVGEKPGTLPPSAKRTLTGIVFEVITDLIDEAYLSTTIETLTKQHIACCIHGIAITGFEVTEIKAVTYHDLTITQENGIWTADIVFDI